MKSLISGCAAAALLVGLAMQAHAQTVVHDAPVHAVPVEEDDAPAADAATDVKAPAEVKAPVDVKAPAKDRVVEVKADAPAPPPAAKSEPAAVVALTQPKAAPAPALTPQENAFFAALGSRVTDAASAYENFVRRAGAIDPAFNGAASVQHAVKVGAAYHPHQLEEGIVAYSALIALRNPEFVDGVRAIQNSAFADGLADHPDRVMQVRGAGAAAADVAGVLRAQGESLIAAGRAVTKAAYDIQGQAWSKSPVADPKGVLDAAKTSAEEMRTATVPSKEKLLDSLVAAPQTAEATAAPAPDVERGLALAALAILGRTGDGMEGQYEALLGDPSSAQCLKMAKLNLNQCLAVAGPNYEDAYCAGRHAVSDTGKCITDAAGAGSAPDAAPRPRLQEADAVGPEQAAVYGKPAPKDEDDDATPAPALAAAPAPAPAAAPAPAPALAATAPLAPAPRQYAEGPALQAPPRAEPMPDPRAPRETPPAPAYAQPPQPQPQLQRPQSYSYAQNDYAPAPASPYPPSYQQPYPQPQYRSPPYQQAYPPPQYQPQYAPQPYAQQYAPQPYAQPQSSYAPSYGGQPSYYPQPYYPGGYYGR